MASIKLGLLGFGTVGSGVYRMLQDNRESIARRVGAELEVVRIGIRDPHKPREAPCELFTTDLDGLIRDPEIQVVAEVIGGLDPAGKLVRAALEAGKHVVTANKELIAKAGPELIRTAHGAHLDLHFEAAVGGGIPLLQPLKHQLAGNEVLKMMGIVNGTTNYILTRMTEDQKSLTEALSEAQAQGYAEADPTADVEGFDAQYKVAILATIATGQVVSPESVYREGIAFVSAADIHFAKVLGYRIKLLGVIEPGPAGLLARVHPTLLPQKHPLANINDVYNAVWIQGDFVGDVLFSGRGAGSHPTASAVVGDLMDVARNIRLGGAGNLVVPEPGPACRSIDDFEGRFYLRMTVADKPKVLGTIATRLGEHGVGLAAMEMRVIDPANAIGEIVFLTHAVREREFRAALAALQSEPTIRQIENWIRVEGD